MWKSPRPRWFSARACGTTQQQRVHLAVVPVRGEQPQRVGRPVDPHIVAVDDQERVAIDQRLGPDHAAAGLQQQRALVGNGDVEPEIAVRHMRLDRFGQIMDVDHRPLDARVLQFLEHMVDQRLAGDLDQRLGPARGQRPHPFAQPGGQHHRRPGHLGGDLGLEAERPPGRGHSAFTQASARFSGVMLASNQRRTGSSSGPGEVALEQPPHARLEGGVMRLVVALPQAGEDAEDARVALRREHPISALERLAVAGRGDVAVDHRPLDRFAARRAAHPRAPRRGRRPGGRRARPGNRAARSGGPRAGLRPASDFRHDSREAPSPAQGRRWRPGSSTSVHAAR